MPGLLDALRGRVKQREFSAHDPVAAAAQTARDAGKNARDQLLDPRLVPGTIGEKYRQAVAEADAADEAVAEVERQLREFDRRIKSEEEWIVQLAGKPEKSLLNYLPIKPPEATGESYKLEEHRTALVRNERRKVEAEAQLVEVKKAATKARKAVEALVPDVLKA